METPSRFAASDGLRNRMEDPTTHLVARCLADLMEVVPGDRSTGSLSLSGAANARELTPAPHPCRPGARRLTLPAVATAPASCDSCLELARRSCRKSPTSRCRIAQSSLSETAGKRFF